MNRLRAVLLGLLIMFVPACGSTTGTIADPIQAGDVLLKAENRSFQRVRLYIDRGNWASIGVVESQNEEHWWVSRGMFGQGTTYVLLQPHGTRNTRIYEWDDIDIPVFGEYRYVLEVFDPISENDVVTIIIMEDLKSSSYTVR